MVATISFQPTLLDCWACKDLKRFRLVLKGNGAIAVTQHSAGTQASTGKDAGGGTLSTSQGRSPGYSWGGTGGNSSSGPCSAAEVNRRDHLGRTVLHLLAASTEPVSTDYLTALLAHPGVNVNLQDHENGWTALHRALYHGNLLTTLTLLRRSPPVDVRLKDFEGLTPFDLYNSTIHGTNPPNAQVTDKDLTASTITTANAVVGELYTWGANRNYTLGVGTSDDRAHPDRVTLRISSASDGEDAESGAAPQQAHREATQPGTRFDRIQVRDVGMSKFATVALTAERASNVWVCGIGNTGRIGRAPQTQPNMERLRDFTETAAAIAVGPDHTCIVTTMGDVYTFGFNRFQQLGYALEQGLGIVASSSKGSGGAASTTFGGPALLNADLDIQISPRKVAGPLKKEHVLGIAAGKLHSAAFTSDALFTWGTNTGQLGYDRAATPSQVVPRKVTAVTSSMSVKQVAVTDFATACLLESGDVLLLHNDAAFFVRFPSLLFSAAQVSVYRPRQARPKPSIERIVAGPNNALAAISDIGDLWQFAPEHPSEYSQASGNSTAAKANIKPQLIWSVRKNKKVGAARDVGLGAGQDMILVTESGHVFVRSRKQADASQGTSQVGGNPASAGAASLNVGEKSTTSVKGKSGWKPVPFLQRVIRVATNESGGLAAIRVDARVRDVHVRGRSLPTDLRDVLPHLKAASTAEKEGTDIVGDLADAVAASAAVEETANEDAASLRSDDEESEVEDATTQYVSMAQTIAEAARRWVAAVDQQQVHLGEEKLALGCDMLVIAGGRHLPAHRSVVCSRLPKLAALLCEPPTKGTGGAPPNILIRQRPGEHTTMTLTRCSFGTALLFLHYLYTDDLPPIWTASIGMRVEKVFAGLKMPAAQIHAQLKELAETLDLRALQPSLSAPVPTHPAASLQSDFEAFFAVHIDVPVQRSPLHDVEVRLSDRVVPCHSNVLRRSPFFAALFQPHWTSTRWTEGALVIDMSHTRWEVARIVLLHLYTDHTITLFRGADADRSADQFIDFVIEVLALSNELLLDKFKLVCCSLLRRRIAPNNVAALMSDADFYHTLAFKESIMDYAARTMETLLESGMLEDLEHRLIKDLTRHVRRKQDERLHRVRADEYIDALIAKHLDYYVDLDVPAPSLGVAAARVPKRAPRSSDYRPSPLIEPGRSRSRVAATTTATALSPGLHAQRGANDGSMMFSMDDDVDESATASDRFALPPPATPTTASAATINNSFSSTASSATPWKSRTAEKHKVESFTSPIANGSSPAPTPQDLRSIMAAEQSTSRRSIPGTPRLSAGSVRSAAVVSSSGIGGSPATIAAIPGSTPLAAEQPPLGASVKMSQKDRKRQQMLQQQQQGGIAASAPKVNTAAPTPLSPTTSPWKTTQQSPATPLVTPSRPAMQSAFTSPAAASPSGSGAGRPPLMGPTFTPTRLRPVVQRRSGSGALVEPAGSASIVGAGTASSSAWGAAAASGSTAAALPYPSLGTSPSGRGDGASLARATAKNGSPAQRSPALRAVDAGATSGGMAAATLSGSSYDGRQSKVSTTVAASSTTSPLPTIATGAVPSASSSSSAVKSFAQIQAEEQRRVEELQAHQSRAPKSFAELQEDDRRENAQRVKEEQERREFERWFEEESRRVKREERQRAGGGATAKKGGGGGKQRNGKTTARASKTSQTPEGESSVDASGGESVMRGGADGAGKQSASRPAKSTRGGRGGIRGAGEAAAAGTGRPNRPPKDKSQVPSTVAAPIASNGGPF